MDINQINIIVENLLLKLTQKVNESLAKRDERLTKIESRLDALERK